MGPTCSNKSFEMLLEQVYDCNDVEAAAVCVVRLEAKKQEIRERKNARMWINKKLSLKMKDKKPLPIIRMRLPIRK
jgi:hypothetical protein